MKKPTNRQYVIKKLKKIAKEHGLKLRFKSMIETDGEYAPWDKTACVTTEGTLSHIISSFFHELGHYVDHTNGIYKNFYNKYYPLNKTRKISLRAERHADRVGKELCKKYFPLVTYEPAYLSKEDVEWNKEYYADGRKK